MNKISKDDPLHVLSVGTRILLKDVMDTYLRSLGEVKTFYAKKLSTAAETYQEKRPKVIFCEQSFAEGGALDMVRAIGGLPCSGEQYFVLAVESLSDDVVSLAMESGMDEVLVKPFSTESIRAIVERYFEKRAGLNQDWAKELGVARQTLREKRFLEAEVLMDAAAKKFAGNASVAIEAAEFFLERNQAAKAAALLEGVLAVSPENVRALNLLGLSSKKQGHHKRALDFFLKASALSPLNSQRNADTAETYLLLAEDQIQQALRNDNEHSSLILARAQFLLVRKDYAALVTYLDNKRSFLSEAAKKEADNLIAAAKKLGGIR
jgi:CheY-like chemotaxis protein